MRDSDTEIKNSDAGIKNSDAEILNFGPCWSSILYSDSEFFNLTRISIFRRRNKEFQPGIKNSDRFRAFHSRSEKAILILSLTPMAHQRQNRNSQFRRRKKEFWVEIKNSGVSFIRISDSVVRKSYFDVGIMNSGVGIWNCGVVPDIPLGKIKDKIAIFNSDSKFIIAILSRQISTADKGHNCNSLFQQQNKELRFCPWHTLIAVRDIITIPNSDVKLRNFESEFHITVHNVPEFGIANKL